MNRYIFKISLAIVFTVLLGKPLDGYGQGLRTLVPDAGIVQYAGSIGFFSVGAGYDIFKNKRGYLDVHYGYVPRSKGGELHALTIKLAYKPFIIELNDGVTIYPLNPGFFLSYSFHGDLPFNFESERYPAGYYYWSPALRPHISFSNEVEFKVEKFLKGSAIKKISLYSEFNTNDYYLINYVQNMKAISFFEILQLGIGVRVKF